MQRLTHTPIYISAECRCRLQVEGNISNLLPPGRIVRKYRSLNGKEEIFARSDVACVKGRCLLNIDAKVSKRHSGKKCQCVTDELAEYLRRIRGKVLQAARKVLVHATGNDDTARRSPGKPFPNLGTLTGWWYFANLAQHATMDVQSTHPSQD